MPRLIHFIFFLLFFIEGYCQSAVPMVFGKIASKDLSMERYEADTTASAVVLGETGQAIVSLDSDGADLRTDFHKRVKIINRSGFGYGNVVIPFYSFKNKEKFIFDKAMVHLPNGEKIKLSKKDVFIEKLNEYWSRARFAFPKIEEGCIVEYTYAIASERIYELTDWFFQGEIPVRYSELRIGFPDRFAYSYVFQGNEGMRKKGEDENGNEIYEGENGKFTLGDRRFVMENAPAMKREGYITTMDDYRARIRFQLAEVMYADGRIDKIMTTWENAKQDLDHHAYFGEQYLKKSRYDGLTKRLAPLAKNYKTEREQAQYFYDFLSKNIKWDGHFSMATRTEKLENIFEIGEARSGEINLMLLVLLREMGIKANPIITSTRSNGKMYEDYPLIDQFNHTMVHAILDSEPIILDVTESLLPMGYPNPEALNGRGVLIKDKGEPEWIDIEAPRGAVDIFMIEMELNPEGNLIGQLSGAYKGYSAVSERKHYRRDSTGQHWRKRLEAAYPDLRIDKVGIEFLEKTDTTFLDTVYFEVEDAIPMEGGYIYFSPVWYSNFFENPFKLSERNYPVDFPYSLSEQYFLTLRLPEGIAVEELPESARFSLAEKAGHFYFSASESEPGVITVMARFKLDKLKFSPKGYPAVKELFDLVAEKFGEQIVLKKR